MSFGKGMATAFGLTIAGTLITLGTSGFFSKALDGKKEGPRICDRLENYYLTVKRTPGTTITTTNNYKIGPITNNVTITPPPDLGPYEAFLEKCDQRITIHRTHTLKGNQTMGYIQRKIDASRLGIENPAIQQYQMWTRKMADGNEVYNVPIMNPQTGEEEIIRFREFNSLMNSIDTRSAELSIQTPQGLEGKLKIVDLD